MRQNMQSLLYTDSLWENCSFPMIHIPYAQSRFRQNITKTPDNFFISPSYQDKVQWKRRVNIKRKTNPKKPKQVSTGRSLKKKMTGKTLRQCPLFCCPKTILCQRVGAMLIPTVSSSECKIQFQNDVRFCADTRQLWGQLCKFNWELGQNCKCALPFRISLGIGNMKSQSMMSSKC